MKKALIEPSIVKINPNESNDLPYRAILIQTLMKRNNFFVFNTINANETITIEYYSSKRSIRR